MISDAYQLKIQRVFRFCNIERALGHDGQPHYPMEEEELTMVWASTNISNRKITRSPHQGSMYIKSYDL